MGATIITKDSKGTERSTTTNATGVYEVRSLTPGKYNLKVSAPGFTVLEEKNVVVRTGTTTNLDLQLSIEALEQSVTIDNRKGVSTDSDRNGDAVILTGREIEALPDDPEALAAVATGDGRTPSGGKRSQVTVNGFSKGKCRLRNRSEKSASIRNPYSAEMNIPAGVGSRSSPSWSESFTAARALFSMTKASLAQSVRAGPRALSTTHIQ